MAIDTASAQALIQTQIQKILIDPLFHQASTFLSLPGLRVFKTAAPISIPTITGHFSPGWVAEGAEIPIDDQDLFGKVDLLPSTMQSLKSIVPITNESLRQSSQALDSIIQARLVEDQATKIDQQAWSNLGNGTTTPKGLQAWSGKQTLAVSRTEWLPDDLLDMQAAALSSNIPPERLRYVMHPATFSQLRKLKVRDDGYGDRTYLIQSDLTKGAGFTLFGSPIVLTSHVPANKVVLLDPQAIAVAVDVNPAVTILKEVFATTDSVGIRVVTRLDWAPVAPNSVIVSTRTNP